MLVLCVLLSLVRAAPDLTVEEFSCYTPAQREFTVIGTNYSVTFLDFYVAGERALVISLTTLGGTYTLNVTPEAVERIEELLISAGEGSAWWRYWPEPIDTPAGVYVRLRIRASLEDAMREVERVVSEVERELNVTLVPVGAQELGDLSQIELFSNVSPRDLAERARREVSPKGLWRVLSEARVLFVKSVCTRLELRITRDCADIDRDGDRSELIPEARLILVVPDCVREVRGTKAFSLRGLFLGNISRQDVRESNETYLRVFFPSLAEVNCTVDFSRSRIELSDVTPCLTLDLVELTENESLIKNVSVRFRPVLLNISGVLNVSLRAQVRQVGSGEIRVELEETELSIPAVNYSVNLTLVSSEPLDDVTLELPAPPPLSLFLKQLYAEGGQVLTPVLRLGRASGTRSVRVPLGRVLGKRSILGWILIPNASIRIKGHMLQASGVLWSASLARARFKFEGVPLVIWSNGIKAHRGCEERIRYILLRCVTSASAYGLLVRDFSAPGVNLIAKVIDDMLLDVTLVSQQRDVSSIFCPAITDFSKEIYASPRGRVVVRLTVVGNAANVTLVDSWPSSDVLRFDSLLVGQARVRELRSEYVTTVELSTELREKTVLVYTLIPSVEARDVSITPARVLVTATCLVRVLKGDCLARFVAGGVAVDNASSVQVIWSRTPEAVSLLRLHERGAEDASQRALLVLFVATGLFCLEVFVVRRLRVRRRG